MLILTTSIMYSGLEQVEFICEAWQVGVSGKHLTLAVFVIHTRNHLLQDLNIGVQDVNVTGGVGAFLADWQWTAFACCLPTNTWMGSS